MQPLDRGWVDIAIRLTLIALIAYWSFLLLQPFLVTLIWAAILAVALFPVHRSLARLLGGRSGPAAALVTILVLVVILGPVVLIGTTLAENLATVTGMVLNDQLSIPPPPGSVAELPLIGGQLSALWLSASESLTTVLEPVRPQIKEGVVNILTLFGNVGFGVLQFTVAILISGFTYSRVESIQSGLKTFMKRAAPGIGESFVAMASGTVRGVARGVIGVSLLQAILFGLGILVAGVPLAGLWTFLALLLAIIQIGPGLIIIPVIIYTWVTMDTVSAGLLTAYLVPVMLVDNILKPLVMGRGLPVPMLLIFIGVIGGTLVHGLIGLFIGPIVLSLAYELGRAWITLGEAETPSTISKA